jgi:splicing factor 3B subunit 1
MADKKGVSVDGKGEMDSDLYGGSKKGDYNKEVTADVTPAIGGGNGGAKKGLGGRPQDDVPGGADEADPFAEHTHGKKIVDREDEYRAKRHKRMLSPDRADPFADATPAPELSTYKDVMIGQNLDKEKAEVMKKIQKQRDEEATKKAEGGGDEATEKAEKKKRRWDSSAKKDGEAAKKKEDADKWATPVGGDAIDIDDDEVDAKKGGGWGATPGGPSADPGETPEPGQWGETPTPGGEEKKKKKRARWDETPVEPASAFGATPMDSMPFDMTPGATPGATPGMTPGATPFGGMGMFGGGTPGDTPLAHQAWLTWQLLLASRRISLR